MQAASNTFRTSRSVRLAAALCSVLISTMLVRGVALAFDPTYASGARYGQAVSVRVG